MMIARRLLASAALVVGLPACAGMYPDAETTVRPCTSLDGRACRGLVLPLDLATTREQRIEVPGLPAGSLAYNAGLAARADGSFVLAFRILTPGQGDQPQTMQVAVTELNGDLTPRGGYSVLDTMWPGDVRPTAEDPRLVSLGETIYVVYNTTHEGHSPDPRFMHIGRLVPPAGSQTRWTLADAKAITFAVDGKIANVEKNWSPFVYEGDLYFLYQSNPLWVVTVPRDALTGPDRQVVAHEVSSSTRKLPWQFGSIRGGTQAVYDPALDAYVSAFHSSTRMALHGKRTTVYYFIGLYTFSPLPPFEVLSMTPRPLVHSSFYRRRGGYQIVFPQGLVVEGDKVQLSLGIDDTSILAMTLDKAELYRSLVPVDEIIDAEAERARRAAR